MNYNELMENANLIAKIYSDKEVLDMSKDLSFEDRMKFNYKIKCIKNDTSYQETFVSFCHRKDFIKKLVCNDELDYIVNNFNKIIQRSADLVDTPLSYLKRNENKINREDLDKIEERIANCTSIYYPNNKEEDRARLKDVLCKTAKLEGTNLLDIRNFNYGCYSKVFKLNNKIIKVGYRRECPEIPENNRILIPYFKGNIGPDFVEVTDYVPSIGNVTDEELYEVYKNIRDLGLIWMDAGKDNLAKVSSDIITANYKRRKDLTNKGIIKNPNLVYEISDVLIIDLDHIYKDDDEYNIERIREKQSELRRSTIEKLENRYNEETNKGITLKKAMYDYPEYY